MQFIGVDIVEIDRIKSAINNFGEKFLQRIYTRRELEIYGEKPSSLAARFAAKEAVIKALGKITNGVIWREIEILSDTNGKPVVNLYGRTKNQAVSLGLVGFNISLSHSREYAIAFVTGETT
ncbi:MAG: holo-ACP synthase [Dehalococcoidales bacterium]|nr:holo-ACP synthase [Dehalococcoidales bacterium]